MSIVKEQTQTIKNNKMSDEQNEQPASFHDDNRVLRYLLHNVKGISPVSGGILEDSLETDIEEEQLVDEFEFDAEI